MSGLADATAVPGGESGNAGMRPGRLGWRAPVALVLAVLWVGGLGSLVAVVISISALRSGSRSTLERRLLLVALVLGVLGVLLTLVSTLLLATSTSS